MKLDTEAKTDVSVLVLPRASRAFLVGTTGTGKSTLMEVMMKEYQQAYSLKDFPVRSLIVDTKPRFRAQWELSGISTDVSRRYSRWGYGSGPIPGSYALSNQRSIKSELDQVWGMGGTTAIIHTERESQWEYASRVATAFYESYGSRYPRLLLVDELADFFKYRSLGDIFQRVARNGRERDVAFVSGSQRPRKVPVEVMTEMMRLYMFQLDFDEDLKHVKQFGIPKDIVEPEGFAFHMWDKRLRRTSPSNQYYILAL